MKLISCAQCGNDVYAINTLPYLWSHHLLICSWDVRANGNENPRVYRSKHPSWEN
jgi:hypothetical protein